MTRLDRFKALMADYHQRPDDYDRGEEEDPRPYFDGSRELEQYALVTVNYSSQGEAKFFFLAFDSRAEAEARGILFATDDIFEELPVAVVDLDSGQRWEPRIRATWSSVGGSLEEQLAGLVEGIAQDLEEGA